MALTNRVNRIEVNPIFCVSDHIRRQGHLFHKFETSLNFETEEGLDYVSTDGFSETLCMHLRRCFDWWGRDAGR